MKKRITAGILAASYLSISTVTPAMAKEANTSQKIVDDSTDIYGNVRTDKSTGVSVKATDEGNEDMDVGVYGNIIVESGESDSQITGLEVNHGRGGESGSNINVTVDGDITVSNESPDGESSSGTGVSIVNEGNGDVSVQTGSVTSVSETNNQDKYMSTGGIESWTHQGNTTLEVDGDVSADATYGDATGLYTTTTEGTTTIEVGGDVTADSEYGQATGVRSDDCSDEKVTSTTDITVEGGISAESVTFTATGAMLNSENGGTVALFVGEDVNVYSEESTATGLILDSADGKTYADVKDDVYAGSDEASANGVVVVLDGERSVLEANIYHDITADGNSDSAGIKITPVEEGMPPLEKTPETTATVWVAGDVVSTGTGILDLDSANSGKTNVVIEGTLNAKGTSVVLAKNAADNLNLTVWKIDTAKKKSIAMEQTEKGLKYSNAAKAFEKTIDYILKIDKNTDGTVKFVDSRKKEITDHDGITSDYNVGHVGETVSVKLNVPDGYYVVAAYSDEAQRTSLRRDRYGEYFLTVPKGGGVMVSLKMAPIVKTDGDGSDDGGNPPAGYGQEAEQSKQDPQVQVPSKLIPTETAIDKGILSASVGSDNSVVLSSEDLGSFIASGGTEFCLRTQAGEFIISAEMLNGLNTDGQPLRIIFTGNLIAIYVGTSTTAAKTIPVTSGETAVAGVAAATGVAATAVAENSSSQAETNGPSLAAQTHTAPMATADIRALAESSDTATAAINLQTNGNSGFQPFAAFSGGSSRAETG